MDLVSSQNIKEEKKYAIGVDLGGTKIGIAVVRKNGDIKEYIKTATNAQQGKDAVINEIKQNIHQIIRQSELSIDDILGIGIGVPGQLDPSIGIVHFAPNLPEWKELPLSRIIEEEFHIPVVIENDANAAAWAEKSFGVAQGVEDMVCLTLGTGIGGGLILDGKIYHGKNFVAGEIGHIIVNKNGPLCGCGGFGCLEAYSSASGIRNRIYNRIKKLKKTCPGSPPDIDIDNIGLAEIFKRARQGDPLVKNIIDDAIEYLGVGITSLVNLLNPEIVVLVGGIANEGDKLLNPVKDIVSNRAMKSSLQDLKIVFGQLGDYAGVVGSAALLWKSDR